MKNLSTKYHRSCHLYIQEIYKKFTKCIRS